MRILVALLAACIASVAFWSSLDRPLTAPDWKGEIRGLAYSPSGLYSEFDKDNNVTDELIRRDLKQLSTMTRRIRTYTVGANHSRIPYVAGEFGMKVSLGIWLGGDKTRNEAEIARAIKVVADNPGTVDRVFVGAMASAITGLSLSYTVGKGVIAGLFTSSKPFMRTPKCEDSAPWTQILNVAKAEAALLIGTVGAIVGTMWSTKFHDPADVVWIAALSVMAAPYAAALLVALFSTMKLGRPVAQNPDIAPATVATSPKLDLAA